ncbi:MAG: hypothetical protein AAGD25_38225 [Cyanobacteria bacterium P01_F01_bin.150]
MTHKNPNKGNSVTIRIELPTPLVQSSLRAIALLLLTVIVGSAPPIIKPVEVDPPSQTTQFS